MEMKTRALCILSCLLLWAAAATAAPADHEHALNVGKRGEITLTQPTKVGDVVLQPDTYQVQHRVSKKDSNHFVRFVELKKAELHGSEWGNDSYTEMNSVGEIKCRVEPAAGPITQTTVYTATDGGTIRITKVAIKGEDVVHIF